MRKSGIQPAALLIFAIAASCFYIQQAQAQGYTATVDATKQFQTFEGWGTSLSWWANGIGGWREPARSDLVNALFAMPPKGLGLTYLRYNIGGGDCPTCNFIGYPHAVPGFEAADGTYNWTADKNQRWVALAAQALGADFFEAQSNSPPYWMTVSGSSTGGKDGADNLASAYEGTGKNSFAAYLATVVQHYHKDFGLTFRAVDPFNEPDGPWWKYGSKKQEGCAFSTAQQQTVIQSLAAVLARDKSLTEIAANDANNINYAYSSFTGYSPATKADMQELNTHSYSGNERKQLEAAAAAASKRLVMSEWGSGPDVSGKDISNQIVKDMRQMHPVDWAIWQPDWPGLVKVNYKAQSYSFNEAYYAFGNYTKFIRPGYQLISINDGQSLAAYDGNTKTLVIVTKNWTATNVPVTYNLANFTTIGTEAMPHRTSSTEHLASLSSVPIANHSFTYTAKADSVTTFVIPNTTYMPRAVSINDKSFRYAGKGWRRSKQAGTFKGDLHASSAANAYYTVAFTGTQARVYAARDADEGIAAYSVDGGAETDVDLYARNHTENSLTYATPTLAPGPHTLKVRVTGLKSAQSSGTTVTADRVDVVR